VASAALSYTYSGGSVAIPDNDGSGRAFTFSLSDPTSSITSVDVSFDISGGHNGDLYAYLSHGSGFTVLLNRPGVGVTTGGSGAEGYANTGFLVTLNSGAAADVHFYQNFNPPYNGSGQLTGTWLPDGRSIDPASAASAFDAAGTANFGSFNGVNPNGTWTLFFADNAPGSISTVNGFSVDVTAVVPEPVNVALGVFAAGSLVAGLRRWRRTRGLHR
jgi:subtilisin-like proprotein convertase family protein